ncbi:hypothetical protein [Metasolibacillus sp.]|uniref:hypothetical protein n=1 Tax=Metasolibacillus sp. TaxID=2703680 RepID=UPI0025F94A22|nr:hypothetical protein [Metasolibacillus sp.]MCT6922871.1 hypothetical protein [Metasolibacillus sp.]MCT6938790.1 hypothetical protein [Metasolibacillus sp.]
MLFSYEAIYRLKIAGLYWRAFDDKQKQQIFRKGDTVDDAELLQQELQVFTRQHLIDYSSGRFAHKTYRKAERI